MSYATIEQANALLGTEWAIDDATKQIYLNQATAKIDSMMNYDACDLTEDQENVFPLRQQTKVPKDIVNACIYEAGGIATGKQDLALQNASLGIKSQSTATATASYDDSSFAKYSRFDMFYSKTAVDYIFRVMPKSSMIGRPLCVSVDDCVVI